MLKNRIANPVVRGVAEWALAIALAFLLFLLFRFLVRTAHVTGNSMEPTLNHGDLVVLTRLGYLLGDPKAGDIIAFPYKEDPSEHYIKRVVGVPGDEIDFKDRRFIINGVPLKDDFSVEPIISPVDIDLPMIVPDGQYFVLGDNRNNSKDSRFNSVGCVPKGEIVGKVAFQIWPL